MEEPEIPQHSPYKKSNNNLNSSIISPDSYWPDDMFND